MMEHRPILKESVSKEISYPRKALAIGFGRYLRERVFKQLVAADPSILEVVAVTCLQGGNEEYEKIVVPVFRSAGLTAPEYLPELTDALSALSDCARHMTVIINTPTGLHAKQALACIDAGFDVYVERPITSHTDDLPQLVAAAKSIGVVLFTGSQRRLETSFQYLHDVVRYERDFHALASIRCTLSSGERPTGWRIDPILAGGGVLMDSGHHQLDYAVWVAGSVGHRFGTESIRYAYLSNAPWITDRAESVEATAVGHAQSDHGSELFFDLSYTAPRDAVFERIEVVDTDGAKVSITREQAKRRTEPGLVTHQRADGSIVSATIGNRVVMMHNAQISSKANTHGPLRSFLHAREGRENSWRTHPSSGASAVASWELVRAIYRHAEWR